MAMLHYIAINWQRSLPWLAGLGLVAWVVLFRNDPRSEQALFAALLVIYMLHQIEEHLWPGGFRQFANAYLFRSSNDDWPVNAGGVALVNTAYVWLPVGLAAAFPGTLRWVGLCWIGLTLINALIHIVTTVRLGIYNAGLLTSIVLFLPFTLFALALEFSRGQLNAADIGLILLAGILLHLPVMAMFVIPFLRRQRKAAH